jgi:hypothetical protein
VLFSASISICATQYKYQIGFTIPNSTKLISNSINPYGRNSVDNSSKVLVNFSTISYRNVRNEKRETRQPTTGMKLNQPSKQKQIENCTSKPIKFVKK